MSFAPDSHRQLESRIEIVPLVGVLAAVLVLLLATMPGSQRITSGFAAVDGWNSKAIEYHTITVKANGLLDVDGRAMGTSELAAQRWQPQAIDRHVVVTLSSEDAATYQDFTDARSAVARMGFADNNVLLVSNGEPED